MLIFALLFVVAVYLGATIFIIGLLRDLRVRGNYSIKWAILLGTSGLWLSLLLITRGGALLDLITSIFSRPNEDIFALKIIGLFFISVLGLPAPIAFAALAVPPYEMWWHKAAVRMAISLSLSLLLVFLIKFRRTCEVKIRDQFGEVVPFAAISYYADGRHMKISDRAGCVQIPFYAGFDDIAIVDATARGYLIDYRLISHRSGENIPAEISLPAWKIVQTPPLLFSRFHFDTEIDGHPCYFNIVREHANLEPLPVTDLEILVRTPKEIERVRVAGQHPEPFPWSVEIRCKEGGIQTAPAKYPYLAPSDNYASSYVQVFTPGRKDWNSSFTQSFYLRLRDGKAFALAQITVTSLYEPKSIIFIDAKVNPAADRNLYPDHTKFRQGSESETHRWLSSLLGSNY